MIVNVLSYFTTTAFKLQLKPNCRKGLRDKQAEYPRSHLKFVLLITTVACDLYIIFPAALIMKMMVMMQH